MNVESSTGTQGLRKKGRRKIIKQLGKERYIHLMILPIIIWLILFAYIPMYGVQIAFKDFMFNKGILYSPWIGLKNFKDFLLDPYIPNVIRNTLGISSLKVFLIYPMPIILALMLNEVKCKLFKKTVQTVSYFPYFISWVILAVMATNWLSPSTGFINKFLLETGIINKPFHFLGESKAFWWISVGLDMWKSTGWGSIIYLSAIAGIDQQLYESAIIDGAGRFRMIWNITIPSILPTIMVLFILNIGGMLNGGLYAANFDASYLLGNALNAPRSEILDTYILKVGLSLGRYSYAAAVGLLSSVISLILIVIANYSSKKLTDESFF